MDGLSIISFAALAVMAVAFTAVAIVSARKEKKIVRELREEAPAYSVKYASMLLYIFLIGLVIPLGITAFAAFYAQAMLVAALAFLTPFYLVFCAAFLNRAIFRVDIDGKSICIHRFLRRKLNLSWNDIAYVTTKKEKGDQRDVRVSFYSAQGKKLFSIDTAYALGYSRLHAELGAKKIEIR